MAPTYSQWVATYPGRDFVTDVPARQDLITEILATFEADHSISVWGDLRDKAVSFFTAHWLAVSQAGQEGASPFPLGPVTALSVSQGSQSVSYGQGEGDTSLEQNLSATIYGKYYLYLKRSLGVCGRVI